MELPARARTKLSKRSIPMFLAELRSNPCAFADLAIVAKLYTWVATLSSPGKIGKSPGDASGMNCDVTISFGVNGGLTRGFHVLAEIVETERRSMGMGTSDGGNRRGRIFYVCVSSEDVRASLIC
jgi:hypothetical protein